MNLLTKPQANALHIVVGYAESVADDIRRNNRSHYALSEDTLALAREAMEITIANGVIIP